MNKLFALAVILLAVVPLSAKDHSSEYRMGTLSKVPLHVGGIVPQGWTDTTSCNSGLIGIHCTGGIVDDYSGWLVADMPDGREVVVQRCDSGASLAAALFPCSQPYALTLAEEDGTFLFLSHTWLYHDSAKEFAGTSRVLYRVEHHGGVTYIKIPDPVDPKKEGVYNPIKLPKQPKEADSTAAADNIAAMCGSGRLSPELVARYCSAGK